MTRQVCLQKVKRKMFHRFSQRLRCKALLLHRLLIHLLWSVPKGSVLARKLCPGRKFHKASTRNGSHSSKARMWSSKQAPSNRFRVASQTNLGIIRMKLKRRRFLDDLERLVVRSCLNWMDCYMRTHITMIHPRTGLLTGKMVTPLTQITQGTSITETRITQTSPTAKKSMNGPRHQHNSLKKNIPTRAPLVGISLATTRDTRILTRCPHGNPKVHTQGE